MVARWNAYLIFACLAACGRPTPSLAVEPVAESTGEASTEDGESAEEITEAVPAPERSRPNEVGCELARFDFLEALGNFEVELPPGSPFRSTGAEPYCEEALGQQLAGSLSPGASLCANCERHRVGENLPLVAQRSEMEGSGRYVTLSYLVHTPDGNFGGCRYLAMAGTRRLQIDRATSVATVPDLPIGFRDVNGDGPRELIVYFHFFESHHPLSELILVPVPLTFRGRHLVVDFEVAAPLWQEWMAFYRTLEEHGVGNAPAEYGFVADAIEAVLGGGICPTT